VKTTTTKQKASTKTAPGIIMESGSPAAAEERFNCISTAAYYKAEARGFMPGQELDDWLEAEANFDVCKGH